MCAIRRQLSGVVKYCLPSSCWPANTSQRRNSAFSRPVALASDAPGHKCLRIYRPPVLKPRHIIAVGDALNKSSRIDRREQAAALVAGDHRRDIAARVGFQAKSGSAIGIGCTLPCVMSSRTAPAERGANTAWCTWLQRAGGGGSTAKAHVIGNLSF